MNKNKQSRIIKVSLLTIYLIIICIAALMVAMSDKQRTRDIGIAILIVYCSALFANISTQNTNAILEKLNEKNTVTDNRNTGSSAKG